MDKEIDRRKVLAGAAGAGAIALAGCVGEEEDNNGGNGGDQSVEQGGDSSSGGLRAPPTPPSSEPDNEYWQYLMDSVEWQNDALAEIERNL